MNLLKSKNSYIFRNSDKLVLCILVETIKFGFAAAVSFYEEQHKVDFDYVYSL